MNRNELLEVVLALQRNINENTNASKTSKLKRMLMQVKQIFKEYGGNYAWFKKYSDLYKVIKKVCCLPKNKQKAVQKK